MSLAPGSSRGRSARAARPLVRLRTRTGMSAADYAAVRRLEAAPLGARDRLAALLRLASRPLASGRVGRDPGARGWLSEGGAIALERVCVGVVERLRILVSPHPEVREVVEKAAEDRVAI